MHLYKFVPETGEWRHRNHLKFFRRRWLEDVSFFAGQVRYPDRTQVVDESEPETERYARYLREASEAASAALQDQQARLQSDALPLPDKAEPLRWFLLSSETSSWTEHHPLPPPGDYQLPFSAWVHARTMPVVINAGASAADESATRETLAAETSTVTDHQAIEAIEIESKPTRLPKELDGGTKSMFITPPRKLMRKVVLAIQAYDMIRPGDKVMIGLSGGKDSLSMLHLLAFFRKNARFDFELAACTVDPQTEGTCIRTRH